MIIKIGLKAYDGVVLLPKSYNHILQAFFYKNMDPYISKFLHNIGFLYGKRRFKLFTFSKVIAKLSKKTDSLLVFEGDLTLYFASPLVDIVKSHLTTLLKRENLFLGKNKVYLESIENIQPKEEEELTVRTLSPITVYRTPKGEKRFHYFNPFQEEFYDILKKNLLKKFNLIYGRNYDRELTIEPVKVKKNYKKKIVFKGTLIEAWEGYFKVKASPEMIRLVQEAGLGSKNSAGFGMVISINDAD